MPTSLAVCPDAHEVAVVLSQPRVDPELLRELTAFRDCSTVIRAHDVRRARDDTDLMLHGGGRIRN